MKNLSAVVLATLVSACVTTPPIPYRVVLWLPPRPPGCPIQVYDRWRRPPGAQDLAWLRLDCTHQGSAICAIKFNGAVCQAGGNAVFGARDEYVQVSRSQRLHYLTGTIGLVPE